MPLLPALQDAFEGLRRSPTSLPASRPQKLRPDAREDRRELHRPERGPAAGGVGGRPPDSRRRRPAAGDGNPGGPPTPASRRASSKGREMHSARVRCCSSARRARLGVPPAPLPRGSGPHRTTLPPSSVSTTSAAAITAARFGGRTSAAGSRPTAGTASHRLVGQVPLARRAARPLAVSYRRSRSFSSAFITIQSSSPADQPRRACAAPCRRHGRDRRQVRRPCSAACSAAAAPPRGSAAASRSSAAALQPARGRAASCRSAARTAARPRA